MKTPSWQRRFKRTLMTGFFVVAPLSLTFILLSWFVALVDGMLSPLVGLIGRPIPGLGIAVALVLVWVAGTLASNIAGQHILEWVEDILLKIPVFNWLYRTIKQVSDVFSPASRATYRSVVLVEYPRPGVYSFGFVTNQISLEKPSGKQECVTVYIPTNHMYVGDYILVPRENLLYTTLTQQQGVQATISAGASLPEALRVAKKLAGPAPEGEPGRDRNSEGDGG